jgi:aconitate hydratase 2/2-methylisocitrate dehydratase
MGNQEKAAKGDTMATLRVSFQGRVVEDSEGKKGESLLSSPVVVLSTILGRTPTIEE